MEISWIFCGMLICTFSCCSPLSISITGPQILNLGFGKIWSGKGIEPFAFNVWKINNLLSRQGRKYSWSRPDLSRWEPRQRLGCFAHKPGSRGTAVSGQPWLRPHVTTHSQAPEPGLRCCLCGCLLSTSFSLLLLYLIFLLHHYREVTLRCVGCIRSCRNISGTRLTFNPERKQYGVLMHYCASHFWNKVNFLK